MSFFNFLLEGETTTQSGGNPLFTFGIIGVALVAIYFLMMRPQKKREKKDAEMRNALAVGDEVTTIGGIIGKVVSIKGETFVLETTKDKTKIRFLRGAIRSVDVKAEDIATAVTTEAAKAEAAPAPVAVEQAEIKEDKPSKRSTKKAKKQAEAAPEVALEAAPAESTESKAE